MLTIGLLLGKMWCFSHLWAVVEHGGSTAIKFLWIGGSIPDIHKNYIVHKFKCRFCIKQFWDSDGYKKVNHDSFGLYLGLSWYVAWTYITICQKHGFKSVVEDNPLCPHTGQKKQNIFVSLHLFWSELWLKLMLSDPLINENLETS